LEIRGNTTGGNGWVVTRIKRWKKGKFREGYVPSPEHSGGPWGVAWTNFPPKSFTPPREWGGNLGKGGVEEGEKGGTGNERVPPGLQRRKTQIIPSRLGDQANARAGRGRDLSQFFQPPTHPTKY
jgi:hypothetical protein